MKQPARGVMQAGRAEWKFIQRGPRASDLLCDCEAIYGLHLFGAVSVSGERCEIELDQDILTSR